MNLFNNFMMHKLPLLIAIGSIPLTQLTINAQEATNPPPKSFATAFEPPNGDKPLATSGGASRGEQCIADVQNSKIPITPILPAINQRLTVASHPTFLIHIPETSAKQVFFKIEAQNQELSYQTTLPISGNAGIIKITLPSDAPSLAIGQNYQWALALICGDTLKPDSPIANGSITRIQPEAELKQQLSSMTEIEQATFYIESGIWYEAIMTIAQLKQEQPDNAKLVSIWQEILGSVGLNNIAKAEFVE